MGSISITKALGTALAATLPTGVSVTKAIAVVVLGPAEPAVPDCASDKTALPPAFIGIPYSYQFAPSSGRQPSTFSLASGSLPDGLTLSTSGLLSGTPTSSARFNFTVSKESDDGPEIEPKVMIRWSNDGSRTWSNEYQRSMGKLGEFSKRIIKRGCGIARQRVFEVSGSASVVTVINACWLRSPNPRST